jgi:alpha-L-fucosidase
VFTEQGAIMAWQRKAILYGLGSLLLLVACAASARADLAALEQAYTNQQYGMFLHYNMGTYTGQQWAAAGQGSTVFNPTSNLSTSITGWATAASNAGMKYGVLTAKHVDGFALWDTSVSTYDVAGNTTWYNNSSNQNYHTDIVGSYANAFRNAGLGVGLYFSVWDQAAGIGPAVAGGPTVTQMSSPAALTYIESQLHELLTNYGSIQVLWLDGFAGGSYGVNFDLTKGTCTKSQGQTVNLTIPTITYAQLANYISTNADIQRVSPNVLLVNDSGKNNPSLTQINEYETSLTAYGFPPAGNTWPSELCDCMIANPSTSSYSWFWNSNSIGRTGTQMGALRALVNSRNATYLLDVPPDKSGSIPSNELTSLTNIKSYYNSLRPGNLCIGKAVTAAGYTAGTANAAAAVVDGDRTNYAGGPNYSGGSSTGGATTYWQIDLGSSQSIGEVDIYSDPNHAGRLRDIIVQVLASDGSTVLYTSPLLNANNSAYDPGSYTNGPAELVANINGGVTGPGVTGQFIRVVRTANGAGLDNYFCDAAEIEAFPGQVPEPSCAALTVIAALALAGVRLRRRRT